MGQRLGIGSVTLLTMGAVLLAGVGCTVQQTSTPDLAGPSDFALSMNVTAIPDSLALDGGSQAAIVVEAHDARGGPSAGVPVRLDIAVGQTIQDCGTLSARTVVTGTDGRANAVFTAPSTPLPFPQCANFSPGNVVTIVATPSGSNFQTANIRTATIRLMPTGVIVPSADTPTAVFTVSPAGPAANSPVAFNASASCGGAISGGVCQSASRIVTYSWDFGDGTAGSGQVIAHSFALARTYTVTLTVTNDRGVASSSTQAVAVAAGTLPIPAFQFSPATPVIRQVVVFDASESRAGTGHTIAQYTWVFGDGDTKTGMVVSHDFTASGLYNVTLTVTDDSGQKATVAKAVTVGAPTTATPKAIFTYSPASPVPSGTTVTVDASASSASNGATIVTYTWDFGDGSAVLVTTAPTTTHQFVGAGTRTMSLTVKDSLGATDLTTRSITVQ